MFRSSPYITAAISSVCREPAIKVIAEFPHWDIEKVETFLKLLIDFFLKNCDDLGGMEYVFEFDTTSGTNGDLLTPTSIMNITGSGANVILLDSELSIQGFDHIPNTSQTELSQYSKRKKSCVICIRSTDMVVYANGLTVKEMNIHQPLRGPVTRKKFARSACDYEISLMEHYKQRIRYGGSYSDHWANKESRVLRNSPKKTERIFHDNLQNWLEENLEGAVVQGGVKKVTADETDIEIRLHNDSRFYILEVKWLGKNESGTTYSESRMRDGIHQVKQYLKRDGITYEACLVVYDGRLLAKFNEIECIRYEAEQWKEIRKCQTEELPSRGKGYIFFLESKSASD